MYVSAAASLHRAQEDFLHQPQPPRTPFVIGLAGSVAVGKSTTARVLQHMLAHWPEHPQVVAGDHRRLPAAQRRARAPRPARTQGVPGVLRPQGAAALRDGHQVRQGRGRGADVLPPHLRRRRRREGRGRPPRHRDHRGPERAAARAGTPRRPHRSGDQRLLRLLRVRRRGAPPTSGAGTSTASCGCARPRSATRRRTSPSTPRSPRTRRSRRPTGSGTRSTGRTSSRTCSPPAAAPRWCCARRPTTRCGPCASASSDRPRTSYDPRAPTTRPHDVSGNVIRPALPDDQTA